jgi:hypothetical protein
MEHFVTLYNSLFLPQGLALQLSMERHVGEYVLWILCVDDEAHDVLSRLDLPNVRLLKLSEWETAELLSVKPNRTISEYCWTLTPFSLRFVFEADPSVQRVTYIDADLWFRKHPRPIFDELDASGKQVLITDHAYAPEYDQSSTSGQYCVQFITFTRDGGEPVRKEWEDLCIDWCFARFEDGKFGDQKYLDSWPARFGDAVHVLQDKERTLAPWNATRFPYGNAVFYHFHGLRLLSDHKLEIGDYLLPKSLRKNVYEPYFKDLRRAVDHLANSGRAFVPQAEQASFARRYYRRFLRLMERVGSLLVDSDQRY